MVQRYIRDPLLYKGRKFDIRHWVLLLHDGSMWALSDGSCRTASVPYIDGCWANSFVHLTNHSVQVLLRVATNAASAASDAHTCSSHPSALDCTKKATSSREPSLSPNLSLLTSLS